MDPQMNLCPECQEGEMLYSGQELEPKVHIIENFICTGCGYAEKKVFYFNPETLAYQQIMKKEGN